MSGKSFAEVGEFDAGNKWVRIRSSSSSDQELTSDGRVLRLPLLEEKIVEYGYMACQEV